MYVTRPDELIMSSVSLLHKLIVDDVLVAGLNGGETIAGKSEHLEVAAHEIV